MLNSKKVSCNGFDKPEGKSRLLFIRHQVLDVIFVMEAGVNHKYFIDCLNMRAANSVKNFLGD